MFKLNNLFNKVNVFCESDSIEKGELNLPKSFWKYVQNQNSRHAMVYQNQQKSPNWQII